MSDKDSNDRRAALIIDFVQAELDAVLFSEDKTVAEFHVPDNYEWKRERSPDGKHWIHRLVKRKQSG